MTPENLNTLTDQELLVRAKKMKSTSIINAVLFGVMIGIAIYSTMKKGLGFYTFFPLIFAFFAFNDSKKNKERKKVLQERNLI